jgi:hypothetical protein
MSNFPDMLTQFGGMPVGSGRYEGMWGSRVWFVDYDHGSAGGGGKKPGEAQKYLDTILAKLQDNDVVYIRPRDPDTTGGDPQSHLPLSTTANYSIAYGISGTSLIGTGVGSGAFKNQANQTRIQGASGVTTATLTSNAPFANFENLCFRRGSSTIAGLKINALRSASGYSFGSTVSNCAFWKLGATATQGGLSIESAWHTLVNGCYFNECALGITVGVGESETDGIFIRGCFFDGVDTTIDADIVTGDVARIVIDSCIFAHDQPALSSGNLYNKYINCSGTVGGLLVNSMFGTETGTISTAATLSNIDVVNCWYAPGSNLTDGT